MALFEVHSLSHIFIKLLKKARMDHKVEDLKKHFSSAILDSACRLQSCTQLEDMQSSSCAKDILWPIDRVREAILHCIENLPRPQVHAIGVQCISIYTKSKEGLEGSRNR